MTTITVTTACDVQRLHATPAAADSVLCDVDSYKGSLYYWTAVFFAFNIHKSLTYLTLSDIPSR